MKWIAQETLAQLGRDPGLELLPAVVAIFVDDCEVNLRALQQALVQENAEELLLLAHTLKSVCATYGAMICRDQALALESACRQLDWVAIREGVSRLQQSLPASSRELQQLVGHPL
ncbi:MAG: Hpt domain-containing protein [Aeromonadaceae bacterium]